MDCVPAPRYRSITPSCSKNKVNRTPLTHVHFLTSALCFPLTITSCGSKSQYASTDQSLCVSDSAPRSIFFHREIHENQWFYSLLYKSIAIIRSHWQPAEERSQILQRRVFVSCRIYSIMLRRLIMLSLDMAAYRLQRQHTHRTTTSTKTESTTLRKHKPPSSWV